MFFARIPAVVDDQPDEPENAARRLQKRSTAAIQDTGLDDTDLLSTKVRGEK